MILYRALYNDELEDFIKTGKISSSLENSYINRESSNKKRKIEERYKCCFEDLEQLQEEVRRMVSGHISGSATKAERSPWISTTINFDVALMYATNQMINGDYSGYILCFEVDDNDVINTKEEYANAKFKSGTVLNLTDDRLGKYRKEGLPVSYTEYLPEYEDRGTKYSISKYATASCQYLILHHFQPNLENCILLSPDEQIVLGTDIQKHLEERINNNCEKEKGNSLKLIKKSK